MLPYRRAGMVLLPLLVIALALGLRSAAWDWGLVTETNALKIGYPDSLIPADFGRHTGGEAGSYFGSYAYDEETFGAAISTVLRLRIIRQQCHEEGVSLAGCIPRLYAGAYADIDMAASPVAAFYFSLLTLTVAEGIYGIQPNQREDLRTPLLRWGRWLALPWLAVAAWIFLLYWFRFVRTSGHGFAASAAFGLYVFLLQPNLLTHGRLLTYNFMVMVLELGVLALCLKWVVRDKPLASRYRWAALTGILGGVGLATKMTLAPALVVACGYGMFISLRFVIRNPGILPSEKRPYTLLHALTLSLLFAGLAAATWYLLVYPALHAAEGAQTLRYAERTLLGREDLQAGTPWGRAFTYMTQTLPAAMGWPLYLTGLGGLVWRMAAGLRRSRDFQPFTPLEGMTAAFLLLTMALYTTNPLGLAVQRTLTVIALFMLFAARGWLDAYRFFQNVTIPRILLVTWAGFILVGMLYGAMATTHLFAKDRPGYRNAMAAWMLQNLHAGDTLWLQGNDPHTLSDLALIEKLPRKPHASSVNPGQTYFHWEMRLPESFTERAIDSSANAAPSRLWGHYYAGCDCGQAVAVFSSPAKTETRVARLLRMGFGYHRWDQIMVQPDFALYAKPSRNAGIKGRP